MTQLEPSPTRWRFWIDRGGTFTDVVACDPNGALHIRKLLSENPGSNADAAVARHPRSARREAWRSPFRSSLIGEVKMGTTVATKRLLERKGDRTLLVTTAGFRRCASHRVPEPAEAVRPRHRAANATL